jgi:hypothetical protein
MPCIQYRVLPAHGRGTYVEPGTASVRREVDRKGFEMTPCEHFREPTAEQVEQDRRETHAHLQRTLAAIRIAAQWRVAGRPEKPRAEVVECPCCQGRLHLFQSSMNGHTSGRCETAGCVSWME